MFDTTWLGLLTDSLNKPEVNNRDLLPFTSPLYFLFAAVLLLHFLRHSLNCVYIIVIIRMVGSLFYFFTTPFQPEPRMYRILGRI